MPRLVRNTGTEIEVCQGRLYNAEFGTIYVDDCDEKTVLPHGWTYFSEDVEVENFIPIWKKPQDPEDAYDLGDVVMHAGKKYFSAIKENVWAPGITGWQLFTDEILPNWTQPLGVHDSYAKGAVVRHAGKNWASEVDENTWEPGVFGWRRTLIEPPPIASV